MKIGLGRGALGQRKSVRADLWVNIIEACILFQTYWDRTFTEPSRPVGPKVGQAK